MGERKYRVGAHLIVAAALLTACGSVHAGTVGLDTGPDGSVVSWFVDADGDGFGDPDQPREGAAVPADGSRLGTDCDDSDAAVHPGADEVCDGVDQDCNGVVDDEATDARPLYRDADGDGFGSERMGEGCAPPAEGSLVGGDCDDTSADVHPGADEDVCAAIDRDCDGEIGRVAGVGSRRFDGIQQAIDAAEPGATVRVCPGRWTEPLDIDKDLTLLGDARAPDAVVLEQVGDARPITAEATSVTLVGLSVSGPSEMRRYEGGLVHAVSETLSIRDCVLEGGWSTESGGAVWWSAPEGEVGTFELVDSRLRDNIAAETGGAAWLRPRTGGRVRISGVTFQAQRALTTPGVFVQVRTRDDPEAGFPGPVVWEDSVWSEGFTSAGRSGPGAALNTFGELALLRSQLDGTDGGYASLVRAGSIVASDVEVRGATWDGLTANDHLDADELVVVDGGRYAVVARTALLRRSRLHRNVVAVQVQDALTLDDVDLGSGSDANIDADVLLRGGDVEVDFDGTVSAVCDRVGCSTP